MYNITNKLIMLNKIKIKNIVNIDITPNRSGNSLFFKTAGIFTLIAFIFTSVLGDVFVQVANAQPVTSHLTSDIDNGFYLPETLGTIDIDTGGRVSAFAKATVDAPGSGDRKLLCDSRFRANDVFRHITSHKPHVTDNTPHTTYDIRHTKNQKPTLIHIQDAHCNYDAQMKIAELIGYLNEKYKIDTINLEGGEGSYDLSVFTGIKDKVLRKNTSDHFVKEGILSGAEFYAANNPGKVKLWGVEKTGLYLKNLNVYRDYVDHKESITLNLEKLGKALTLLKTDIFSEDLIKIDRYSAGYRSGSIKLEVYTGFLAEECKDLSIESEKYEDLCGLNESFCLAEKIDFEKANAERAQLIDVLEKMLSRNELEKLVKKTVEFQKKNISEQEFYGYLMDRADFVNIDLNGFSELQKYMGYLEVYRHVDKTRFLSELNGLESEIREKLFENNEQRTLDELSRDLILIKNMFDLTLTREDYNYYCRNSDRFSMERYSAFIKKNSLLDKEDFSPGYDLDEQIKKMSKFYEYSFERDNAFIENLRFSTGTGNRGSGSENDIRHTTYDMRNKSQATILIAGGFHAENLAGLCARKGINCISICPNFKNEEGYESPYQRLISGKNNNIQEQLSTGGSNLAVYSYSCENASKVYRGGIQNITEWVEEVAADIRKGVDPTGIPLSGNKMDEVIKNKFNKKIMRKYVEQDTFTIADIDVPLYTDNLKSCVSLVVMDKRNRLHYLNHFDGTASKNDIKSSLEFEGDDGRRLDITGVDTEIYVVEGMVDSGIQEVIYKALLELGVGSERIKNARVRSFLSYISDFYGTALVSYKGKLYRPGGFSFQGLNELISLIEISVLVGIIRIISFPPVFIIHLIRLHVDKIVMRKYEKKIKSTGYLNGRESFVRIKKDVSAIEKGTISNRKEFSNNDVFSAENNLTGTKLWDTFIDKNGGEEPVLIELTGTREEIKEQYVLRREELIEKGYDTGTLVCFSVHISNKNKKYLIDHWIVVGLLSTFAPNDIIFNSSNRYSSYVPFKFYRHIIEDKKRKNLHWRWEINTLLRKGLMRDVFINFQKNISENFEGWTISGKVRRKETQSVIETISDASIYRYGPVIKRIWNYLRAYITINRHEKVSFSRDRESLRIGRILPWDQVKENIARRKTVSKERKKMYPIKVHERFGYYREPEFVPENWYEVADITKPLWTDRLVTCLAVVLVDKNNGLHYMGHYNPGRATFKELVRSFQYNENGSKVLDIHDKSTEIYIVKGIRYTDHFDELLSSFEKIGIPLSRINIIETVDDHDDYREVVTHNGRFYLPGNKVTIDGIINSCNWLFLAFGTIVPALYLFSLYEKVILSLILFTVGGFLSFFISGVIIRLTPYLVKIFVKYFFEDKVKKYGQISRPLERFVESLDQNEKEGRSNHPFRFPYYIWAGDETHKGFKDYLKEYDDNLYQKVKENGLAWTDDLGQIHWIDEKLNKKDADKVWVLAKKAINQHKKPGRKIGDVSEVKNVILFHENMHKVFRDKKYKMLISHFKKKLVEKVFNGNSNFGMFISAFRETYGNPHFEESSTKKITNWYLEEFLVLCIQERFLFQDNGKVLDAIITNEKINRLSARLILKNKKAIQGIVLEIIDSAVKLDRDGNREIFKDRTIDYDFDDIEHVDEIITIGGKTDPFKDEDGDPVDKVLNDPNFQRVSAKLLDNNDKEEKEYALAIDPQGDLSGLDDKITEGRYQSVNLSGPINNEIIVHVHLTDSLALPSYGDLRVMKKWRSKNKNIILCRNAAVIVKNIPDEVDLGGYRSVKRIEEALDFFYENNIDVEFYGLKRREDRVIYQAVEKREEIHSLLSKPIMPISAPEKVYLHNKLLAKELPKDDRWHKMAEKTIGSRISVLAMFGSAVSIRDLEKMVRDEDIESIKSSVDDIIDLKYEVTELGYLLMELLGFIDVLYPKKQREKIIKEALTFEAKKAFPFLDEIELDEGLLDVSELFERTVSVMGDIGELLFMDSITGGIGEIDYHFSDELKREFLREDEELIANAKCLALLNPNSSFLQFIKEKSPFDAEAEEKNRKDREGIVCDSFKDVNGRPDTVWTVAGIPAGLKQNQKQKLSLGIGRTLAENGYGKKFNIRQVILFEIDLKDVEKTKKSFNEVMEITQGLMQSDKENGRLPANGKIIAFVPEMKNLKLASEKMETYDENIKIIPDAYTDLMYPDILARVALARHIAFYYNGNANYRSEYLVYINRLFSQISFIDEEITDLDEWRKNNVLRMRAIDYQDIVKWIDKQKQFAKSA